MTEGADSFRWTENSLVASQLEIVERVISEIGKPSGRFHYQLSSPRSKRLRPTLLLLSARLGSKPGNDVLVRCAAAVELIHEGTLYHDDIVDEATTRRGCPTVQHSCGPDVAALAGSELLYASTGLILDLPPELRAAAAQTADMLCRGQCLEVQTIGKTDLTILERLRIMRLKTASLFELAARVGGALSGAPEPVQRRLVRFGIRFGLSFQLADDLRDVVADEELLGRTPGADLRDGVYTLPVIYALAAPYEGGLALSTCLLQLQRMHAPKLVGRAIEYVRDLGGAAAGLHTLRVWIGSARRELDPLREAYGPEIVEPFYRMLHWLWCGVEPQVISTYAERQFGAQ